MWKRKGGVAAMAAGILATGGVLYLASGIAKNLLADKPVLYWNKKESRMSGILRNTAALRRSFRVTFWAHSAYAQLALHMFHTRMAKKLRVESHVLDCPDGGQVAVKEFIGEGNELRADAPVLLLLHTITGEVDDEMEFARYSLRRGWRPVMLCRRGHLRQPLSTPRFNLMGDAQDTAMMVRHAARCYHQAKFIGAVGLSAGSGQLVSYLGQQRHTPLVRAAVSVCPAYSIDKAFINFQQTSPWLASVLLARLKRFFLEDNSGILGTTPGFKEALRTSSIHDFMKLGCHMAGHDSYSDYMAHSNPMSHYAGNEVPCLILNSLDDPLCVEENITYDLMETHANYALATTNSGSHVAFREGLFGQSCYIHELALDFLESALRAEQSMSIV